jgi:peptidylprolyl isomerase
MKGACCSVIALGIALTAGAADAPSTPAKTPPRTMSEVLAATGPADWRPLDPENTLYLQLPQGRVVIELAPAFAPQHAQNLRVLARGKYFDGLAIVRSQDNFVVQWGDSDGKRSLGSARDKLPPEFTVKITPALPFEPLPDRDGYAPEVGFSQGFPAGRDSAKGEAWLAHCYAMVGAGRGNEADSGSGAELYVVTGHAPRQLDRNIALVGRVVKGIELLATQPRGTGPMGFYEKPEQNVPIASVRVAADVPAAERENLEVLRTDTDRFRQLVEARRNRRDDWYLVPAGYIDLCNVPIVARPRP